jgi:hypothetical protein
LEKIEERFLKNVERKTMIAGQAIRERGNPIAIAKVQGFKRASLAHIGGGDKLLITP